MGCDQANPNPRGVTSVQAAPAFSWGLHSDSGYIIPASEMYAIEVSSRVRIFQLRHHNNMQRDWFPRNVLRSRDLEKPNLKSTSTLKTAKSTRPEFHLEI